MAIAQRLKAADKDLGDGFVVRRLLPSARCRSVGPFVFFDHFGPVSVQPDSAHDVRPHPHIGLATVTYMFEGAIQHRDSLGFNQRIEPGAINWMTAGRGIVHSERRPDDLRCASYTNHGIQLWAALPIAHEEAEPSFSHTPAVDIPQIDLPGATVRVLIGEAFGRASPVHTFTRTLYLDVALQTGASLNLPALVPELAVYALGEGLVVDGEPLPAHTLAVLAVLATPDATGQGKVFEFSASNAVRFVIVGGEPLDAPRFMWWNFVSSSRERIEQAAQAWASDEMGAVPGDVERIPLPDRKDRPVPGTPL